MNVYQLTQRYPQIVIRESRQSGAINVRRKKLVIDVGDYEEFFYGVALHEICHFIEVEEDRIFLPNIGIRPIRGAGSWRRWKGDVKSVRKAAFRELRVETLVQNSGIHTAKVPKRRLYPSDFEYFYTNGTHRCFPQFNRRELLEFMYDKYKEYSKKYNQDYFFSELERRLDLIRNSY